MALELDPEQRTASLIRKFAHPDGILSPAQGSMQQLDGGGAFIGWGGVQPHFTEFGRDGRPVFDARFLAKGVETYRAYRMPWQATPAARPHAVATGERTIVHVSWNGATEVSRWRVRSGNAAVTATRRGFETTVHVRGRPRRVVVDALDSPARCLAQRLPPRRAASGGRRADSRPTVAPALSAPAGAPCS